jgi:uncharacterized integral membrane protein
MWGLIFALLIAIFIASFASLNAATVSVNFFFWQAPEVSLALVVLFSVLTGVVMAFFFGIPQYIKNMKRIRELEKKLKECKSGEVKHEEKKEQAPPQN